MLNYQALPALNPGTSRHRVDQAARVLGVGVVAKLLALALYLLGANRKAVAAMVGLPLDTLKSLIRRVGTDGLPALEDRRRSSSTFLAAGASERPRVEAAVRVEDDEVIILLDAATRVAIPRKNRGQVRAMLLTLLGAKLLSLEQVTEGTGLSAERARKLAKKLQEEDVSAVMDQRRGQQRDYRVTEEAKAELIQQFVVNLATNASTSSSQLSDDLKARCRLDLKARTIRVHVDKLGLSQLRKSLPELLAGLKKTADAGGQGQTAAGTDPG